MTRLFVDANVFMRFFAQDDLAQMEQADRLFAAAAAGAVSLVTGPPVLFEVAWTLRSQYGRSNEETLDALASVLGLRGLELTDRALVDEAVRLAQATGQEFADAYIAASTQTSRADAVATFNRRHFDKLGVALYDFPPPDAERG